MTTHHPDGEPPTSFVGMSDADIAHHFARCIPGPPAVRWTSYTVVADCVRAVTPTRHRDLDGWRVSRLLLPRQHAPWQRLRNREGAYNAPGTFEDPAARKAQVDALLRAEGCPVDSGGIADPRYFIATTELLAIAGLTPLHDPLVAARTADPGLSARVAARRAARQAERGV